MNTIRQKTFQPLVAILIAILAFMGCSREAMFPDPMSNNGKSRDVVFSVNIPRKSDPSTRALGDNEESEIRTIEMLIFDPATKNVVHNPIFADAITADPDNDGSFRKKSFLVRLPEGKFDVMIFANSRAAFNAITIQKDEPQDVVLAKLKATMPADGWVADPNDATKRYLIPMWGMREGVSVGAGTIISGIYLHRMLSRIDVRITGDDTQTGNFKLKEIKLYNVQKEGRIAPVLTHWSKNGMVNGTLPAGLATAPSLTTSGVYSTPISYASAIATDKKSCVGEIYAFEAPKATAHADQNAPFLTIKGEYNGVDGWYRIDFANYSNMSYLDLLRNHLYNVGINKVSGTGFPNEEDAKKNRGDNIIVDITLWNEYDLGGIWFSPQYFLSISPQDRFHNAHAHTLQTITIKTDDDSPITLANNIKISSSDSNPNAGLTGNWITNVSLSPKSVINNKNVYTLTYNVEASHTDERFAYIYVTVGRITGIARIEQDAAGLLMVSDHLILRHQAQAPAVPRLTVDCFKFNGELCPDHSWTLSVPSSCNWLKISFSPDPATAVTSVSGVGSQDIYIFVQTNTSLNYREVTLTLLSYGSVMGNAIIRQLGDLPPEESLVSERTSCVGAFWRWDQTGERIVQIAMGKNSGMWMAKVEFYDENWDPHNGDGVLLAASGSPDQNLYTNNPGDAEDYQLRDLGYGNAIGGTVEEDGSILFRIGLEQEYTAYNASTKPARYAVVELWYANYTKMQKIYLRQGEGADFLMRTQDAVNSGGYNNATRPSANKFTVYNLTSSPLNKSVGTRGAIPTQYPSQIGAYFQWTGNTNAYAPFGGISPIPSWPSNTVIPANTPWSSSYETCPVGYRRPKDTDDPNGPVMNSEIKQSLWEKPQMGYGNNESNILFGYYADGFYDRRKVERLGGSANANGYVAGDTPEMAWGGRLFYNPVTNASLFFPVGKGRNFNDGVVPPSLTYAHYQTSSEGFSAGRGMALHSSSGDVLMNVVSKSAAYNVRCVKE